MAAWVWRWKRRFRAWPLPWWPGSWPMPVPKSGAFRRPAMSFMRGSIPPTGLGMRVLTYAGWRIGKRFWRALIYASWGGGSSRRHALHGRCVVLSASHHHPHRWQSAGYGRHGPPVERISGAGALRAGDRILSGPAACHGLCAGEYRRGLSGAARRAYSADRAGEQQLGGRSCGRPCWKVRSAGCRCSGWR